MSEVQTTVKSPSHKRQGLASLLHHPVVQLVTRVLVAFETTSAFLDVARCSRRRPYSTVTTTSDEFEAESNPDQRPPRPPTNKTNGLLRYITNTTTITRKITTTITIT